MMKNVNHWSGAYKIPWHEPEFSRRMLAEHLSQEHDLASRRLVWIDRQVAWIHSQMLAGVPSRVLDLGCGPGLYANRLGALGHTVLGIDFGPASIAHARSHSAGTSRFLLADLRTVAFEGPHDLALMLYGEMNVFAPVELHEILRRVHDSLVEGGQLVVEAQTAAGVERLGRGGSYEEEFAHGLFSDDPYRCRTECRWDETQRVAVRTFTIEQPGVPPRVYKDTAKAWTAEELKTLLQAAGFCDSELRTDWPCDMPDMALWRAWRSS